MIAGWLERAGRRYVEMSDAQENGRDEGPLRATAGYSVFTTGGRDTEFWSDQHGDEILRLISQDRDAWASPQLIGFYEARMRARSRVRRLTVVAILSTYMLVVGILLLSLVPAARADEHGALAVLGVAAGIASAFAALFAYSIGRETLRHREERRRAQYAVETAVQILEQRNVHAIALRKNV